MKTRGERQCVRCRAWFWALPWETLCGACKS